MTSASELFHNRRSRFGRSSVGLGLETTSLDPISHRHHPNDRRHMHNYSHNNRRDRQDPDGFDPPRRSPLLRHPINRLYQPEREPVRHDQGGGQSASGNIINSEDLGNIRDRQRSVRNGRLPGAVLLARERLLERLSGVSLSGNRQSNRASSRIHHDDLTFGGNITGLFESQDSDMENWLAAFTDSNYQTGGMLAFEETRKRPPGLTPEALNSLQIEVFNVEESEEGVISRASHDCSICLESFREGDELICLPCRHRFHSCCLHPWVQTCGDCPNCRKGIVLSA